MIDERSMKRDIAGEKGIKGIKHSGMRMSLKAKIFIPSFALVLSSVLIFAALSIFHLADFTEVVEDAAVQRDRIIERKTTERVEDTASHNLTKYVDAAADIVDGEFRIMKHDVELLAESTAYVLENPGNYAPAGIEEPKKEDAGRLTSYILYSTDADKGDKDLLSRVGRLSNLCPMMESMVSERDDMREVMISLPDGATIYTDRHPEEKIDDDGNIRPFDMESSKFYQGAVIKEETYFTPTVGDIFNEDQEVSVGVPVYVDGELAAVCGGARHLSDMDNIMESIDFSEDSYICLINDTGMILYSQWQEGELSRSGEKNKSIMESSNEELVVFMDKAIKGGRGCEKLTVDGESVYMAYAPLEVVGWTLMLGTSESTLERPASELLAETGAIERETLNRTRRMSLRTQSIMLVIAAVLTAGAFLLALRRAGRTVKPIVKLKNAGRRFIERDYTSLDKDLNYFGALELYTGDEIEELWTTMKELETGIASSVQHLNSVTAEKERIDTELSVAKRIQADMLPGVFPAFPERTEFDLYSTMNPAKEVGGDFYDFFLMDDDHLVLVMADVSGKGVPAALFMVVAKTLIKNIALSGVCRRPGEILYEVNNELCLNNIEEMFVTVWLGIITLSSGQLVSASGGHEYPAICRRGGGYELIKDEHGPGLGTFEDVDFEEWEGVLGSGDLLFLYTDGIPEAENSDKDLFGMERMLKALNESREEESLEKMLQFIRNKVNEFAGEAAQF
ncbi:MAG: SpoIIE family protein phosphatase, partial [Lachnospiraceae bacterium]|nr:SpoIIE family protein phosphatase [Lachnospiraceae bacterium]